MPHAVHLTRTLPHSPEAVWAALTDAEVAAVKDKAAAALAKMGATLRG